MHLLCLVVGRQAHVAALCACFSDYSSRSSRPTTIILLTARAMSSLDVTLTPPADTISAVVFSPSSKNLLAASWDSVRGRRSAAASSKSTHASITTIDLSWSATDSSPPSYLESLSLQPLRSFIGTEEVGLARRPFLSEGRAEEGKEVPATALASAEDANAA